MTAVVYVLATAALMVLWGLLSSRFPRFAVLANGAAVIYLILTPPLVIGFGWTVLGFLTAGFGLVAALGGLLEQRQRTAETAELPRAKILLRGPETETSRPGWGGSWSNEGARLTSWCRRTSQSRAAPGCLRT